MSLAYFTQYDKFWVYPWCCKWQCFTFFCGWIISHYIYIPYLLYPFMCFCWWTFTILPCLSAIMNTGAHISFWIACFISSIYMPKNEIAGSHGNFIFKESLCSPSLAIIMVANFYFHQQCIKVSFSPLPYWCLLFVDFLMMAILTNVRWHIIVAFDLHVSNN